MVCRGCGGHARKSWRHEYESTSRRVQRAPKMGTVRRSSSTATPLPQDPFATPFDNARHEAVTWRSAASTEVRPWAAVASPGGRTRPSSERPWCPSQSKRRGWRQLGCLCLCYCCPSRGRNGVAVEAVRPEPPCGYGYCRGMTRLPLEIDNACRCCRESRRPEGRA